MLDTSQRFSCYSEMWIETRGEKMAVEEEYFFRVK